MLHKESQELSVCIPTYNRPNMIVNAIDSVLAQSFCEFELLVHDNSDNEETENVVRSYRDDRIVYRRHNKNIGLVDNWNSLLYSAKGKYVKFLNDDDWFEDQCLEVFINMARECPGVSVLTCRARYVNDDGNCFKEDSLSGNGEDYFVRPEMVAYLWYQDSLPLRTPTHTMYERETALRLGGFDKRLDYARDVFLALRMACDGGALFLEKKPLVNFVKHPGQDVVQVPFDRRVSDQVYLKHWVFEHIDEHSRSIAPSLLVVDSSIRFREIALMLRREQLNLVPKEFFKWLKTGGRVEGLIVFLKRFMFPKHSQLKFETFREYIGHVERH